MILCKSTISYYAHFEYLKKKTLIAFKFGGVKLSTLYKALFSKVIHGYDLVLLPLNLLSHIQVYSYTY